MAKKLIFNNSGIKPSLIILGLLILVYIINGIQYLRSQSVTSDEGSFMNYAIRLVKGHPERLFPVRDNSKMPVSVINLIPRAAEQFLHPGLLKADNGDSDIFAGRYITLLVSIFPILLVYKWSKELYGINAGLFSAFLLSFCPNTIANAGLVTTDSYSMLLLLVSMYCLWKFCNERTNKYFILFSACIGFSQLVKQSLFHLYIIFPLALVLYYWYHHLTFRLKTFFIYFFGFCFINWLIINAGFYFRDTNTAIGKFHFISNAFSGLQQILPSWMPIPLPNAFVSGLDMAKYYDQVGGGNNAISSFGKVTILGHSSTGSSFWYYYFVSLFYKTPVSSIIFTAAGIITMARVRSLKTFMNKEFFLLLPVLYFLLYMSFIYNTQCGIRQIIFIYPFLYILSGGIIPYIEKFYPRLAVIALCIFLLISVSRYWANYYPYTNEFITDKKMAYSYVGASNLEFHQGAIFFSKYLEEHPDVHMATAVPGTGTYLINTADYLDIWNLHLYDWLAGIKPSGHVAFNGLLITVTAKDIQHNRVKPTDDKR